jgi:hypothetical protein
MRAKTLNAVLRLYQFEKGHVETIHAYFSGEQSFEQDLRTVENWLRGLGNYRQKRVKSYT